MKFTLIITYQGCDMFESTKIKKSSKIEEFGESCDNSDICVRCY